MPNNNISQSTNIDPELKKTLESLKPIHYPKDSLYWPPAPAHIILYIVLFVLIIKLSKKIIKKAQRRFHSSPKQIAWAELQNIETEIAHINQQPLEVIKILYGTAIQRTTLLLKKAAISKYNDSKSLSGDKWLEFLIHSGKLSGLNEETGKIITTMTYQEDLDTYSIAELDEKTKKLIAITKEWINKSL